LKAAWSGFKAIVVKDLAIELRARQVLPTMIVLGMLIVFILRLVSEPSSGQAEMPMMAAAALWIAFLFSGLLAQERSFGVEQQNGCIDGLWSAPLDAATVYLAKLFANVVILGIFEVVIVPVVLLTFELRGDGRWLDLVTVLALGNIGISGVGTLFSAVVQLPRTRGALLSIVVLVLLLPMLIPASFALLVLFGAMPDEVAGSGAMAFVGSFQAARGYMVAFDAVFVVACWLLFGVIVEE
jgi:heme exporter protein CcmB